MNTKKKDRKLLVRVSCTTKNFYLSPPPPGSNDWQIRFTPPRDVRDKLKISERIRRTTGKAEIEPAKAVARQIIEKYWSAEEAESVKQRNGFATLAEIVQRYRDGARAIADHDELAHSTIGKNITSLIRIVETRFTKTGEKRVKGSWENMTADVLTPQLLQDFKRGWLAAVDRKSGHDLKAMSSAKHTVNSYVRQARSLFGEEYMELYRDLDLPDLTEFHKVRMFKNLTASTRYVPIPQRTIDAMEAEIRALRETRPDLYLAFYFMLWLGMRVSEVRNVRLEWVEEWPTGARMAIVRRSYYKPKGIDGVVAITPSLLADIRELSGAKAADDFLIPAPNVTARHDVLRRELSGIVRRHLGADRHKTCHELRKHAISMVLMRTRNYVDTLKFSRHSDVRTLQNHYAGFLDDLPAITSSNWRDVA